MPRFLWTTTAAIALTASAALAQQVVGTPEELAQTLLDDGYTHIEIKVGPTQTKVESVRGTEELEYVFDQMGNILSLETGIADDDLQAGVEIEREDEDFVDADGSVEDEDDEDEDEDDSEEDEDHEDDEDDEDEDEDDEDEDEDDQDDSDSDDDDDDNDDDDDDDGDDD